MTLLEFLLALLSGVVASSGFWIWLEKRSEKKSARNRLLMGLAHDRILDLGMTYITRGWITRDEYENLNEYLYKPYQEMGGNSSGNRVMCEVEKLPIREGKFSIKDKEGECQ